jgi:adenylate cyclase
MEQTFCFVDLAGFSALTEVHGDETGADLVERFTNMARAVLVGNGELVATVGDAVFLVFNEPSACLSFLEWLWRRTEEERNFPALRAGVHEGEAVRRGRDFYGTAVNVAARVAAQARGGQVLGTASIAAAAAKLNLRTRSLGVVELKNLRKPLELFAISITTADALDVIDPVCRMRVIPNRASAHLESDGEEYWFCSKECLREFVGSRR